MVQKGSREHYILAKALYGRNMLAGLVTDWYSPALIESAIKILKCGGGKNVSGVLARRCKEIPDELVQSCCLRTFARSLISRSYAKWKGKRAGHLVSDRAFGSWVAQLNLPPHDVFFGFSYASLEILRVEKKRGVFTILDQFDAAEYHEYLTRYETKKSPTYTAMLPRSPVEYYKRVRQEWKLADLIITNSEWTKKALLKQGLTEQKIEICPLGYDPPRSAYTSVPSTLPQTLRVLWLGNVNVAKGIKYFVEAARALEGNAVEFIVAGPLAIKSEAIRTSPSNIKWLGQVSKKEVEQLLKESHILASPTISDNFAITQLEAMSHGVPVILTTNCGHVVENGETGFIIPPFSSEALASAILRFVENPHLVQTMSKKCMETAKRYNSDAYIERLTSIIRARTGNE